MPVEYMLIQLVLSDLYIIWLAKLASCISSCLHHVCGRTLYTLHFLNSMESVLLWYCYSISLLVHVWHRLLDITAVYIGMTHACHMHDLPTTGCLCLRILRLRSEINMRPMLAISDDLFYNLWHCKSSLRKWQ